MRKKGRYDASGLPEGQFEPGSHGRVLRNKLGIVRVSDMKLAESQVLWLAQRRAIDTFSDDHRFTAADVRALHQLWLKPIYAWAGEYRSVNISKGGFQFAAAHLIPELMVKLEKGPLARFTPSREAGLSEALAVVHAELILIHPFRDGNGRLARLLALLMGLQAGLPPLDFSPLDGRGRKRYVAGIHAALDRDYAPLAEEFEKVIERTRKRDTSSMRRMR